jgi:hypothetical protein
MFPHRVNLIYFIGNPSEDNSEVLSECLLHSAALQQFETAESLASQRETNESWPVTKIRTVFRGRGHGGAGR